MHHGCRPPAGRLNSTEVSSGIKTSDVPYAQLIGFILIGSGKRVVWNVIMWPLAGGTSAVVAYGCSDTGPRSRPGTRGNALGNVTAHLPVGIRSCRIECVERLTARAHDSGATTVPSCASA